MTHSFQGDSGGPFVCKTENGMYIMAYSIIQFHIRFSKMICYVRVVLSVSFSLCKSSTNVWL